MSSLKENVARNLRILRAKRNMSASALAEAVGSHQTTVSDWERAKKMPRDAMIEKIANLFGVTTSYILANHEVAQAPSQLANFEVIDLDSLLASEKKVIVAGRVLTQSEKEMLARIATATFSL